MNIYEKSIRCEACIHYYLFCNGSPCDQCDEIHDNKTENYYKDEENYRKEDEVR